MDYSISYDVSRFLDTSVHEVIKTLLEAFLLVSLVVFIFLQDFRSTLIPALTVPVSLIGTLFFIYLFGFSLNLITLFALVLAIGIVIDDAIVVVEAVHAKMELGNTPKKATELAIREISGAILAITLVMSAVFIPTSFLEGPVGIFFRQFSLTMAIAIVLSGIVALTITPALCASLLKHTDSHSTHHNFLQKFFHRFNERYVQFSNTYLGSLKWLMQRNFITMIALFFFCLCSGLLSKVLPTGFIPNEDQGMFYASITTPSGSTLERTKSVVNEIQRACDGIEAIESVATLAGTNVLSDCTGATYGTCLINLKPWQNRKESITEIIQLVEEKTAHIRDASIEYFPPPAVPGYGNASGFELRLLDQTGTGDLKNMEKVTQQFLADLKK
jgi:HAE1 family hydrophobic/amphiphilic exporter-1